MNTRLLSAALLACLSSACTSSSSNGSGAAKPVTFLDNTEQLPATPAALDEVESQQRVLAFLRERYGASASLSDAWRESWIDERRQSQPLHRHLCSNHAAMVDGVQQSLLAVCANVDDAVDPGEHGLIDFIALRASDSGEMDVVMERLDDRHGSRGVPGDVSVLQLGATLQGYRIENGWFGQGYSLLSQSLLLATTDGIKDAGTLRSHIDNDGGYECDVDDYAGEVFNLDFILDPDNSKLDLNVWPLRVHESGVGCDGVVSRDHLLAFDPVRAVCLIPTHCNARAAHDV